MNLLWIALAVAAVPMHTLKTKWAEGVTAANVHQEYPRPQMVRKNWVNLNGLWNVSVSKIGGSNTSSHQILVPFPIESQLSGASSVMKAWEGTEDASKDIFIYSRTFKRPKGDRILLHFGAVNWTSNVIVNGHTVGVHTGGYDPFSFDITSDLSEKDPQLLQVVVVNPMDAGFQPRGKQVRNPEGIFYTASTGIWQTVWLEPVPKASIDGLRIEPDRTAGKVKVTVNPYGDDAHPGDNGSFPSNGVGKIRVEVLDNGKVRSSNELPVEHSENVPEDPGRGVRPTPIECAVKDPVDWSPENPHLYDLRVTMYDPSGKQIDQVTSYFGFRDISLVKNANGQPQIALNGKPYFLVGPLDQGFWPDGLYTAPSDEAMKYDLEVTKRLGFNMIRKHVKVEPERWYYWCDKMGILVMQDMPSGDKFISPKDADITRSEESANDYKMELNEMISSHWNHPSIVTWVLYNEGWGQWNTEKMTKWLEDYDPTRLVDSTTGWADRGVGNFSDIHSYPGPDIPKPDANRAIFLGEFGGLGLPVPDHMWREKGWGYQSFKTSEELTNRFVELFAKLKELKAEGLSGAVYTQTTDVETELNGLMTYDRAVLKMDEARVKAAVMSLRD